MKPIVLGFLTIPGTLMIAASASADLPIPMDILPGKDRSIVIARFLPIKTKRSEGYLITKIMIRVYSGYPGGASLMQRFTLWRGRPVDMGFATTRESGIRNLSDSSCFATHKKIRLLTSSYRIFLPLRNRTENRTGRTLIHRYYC